MGSEEKWAAVFFDKCRRVLSQTFDQSDYAVAEGLTVMGLYSFLVNDMARLVQMSVYTSTPNMSWPSSDQHCCVLFKIAVE